MQRRVPNAAGRFRTLREFFPSGRSRSSAGSLTTGRKQHLRLGGVVALWKTKARHTMFATHIGRLGFGEGGHGVRVIGLIGLVRWAASLGWQALCGLRGHEMVRHFEPARLSLRCVACGAETPGWTIDVRPAFRSVGPARAKVHRLAEGVRPGPSPASSRSDPCPTLICAATLKNQLVLRIIRPAYK
jgi:hypothetical protein